MIVIRRLHLLNARASCLSRNLGIFFGAPFLAQTSAIRFQSVCVNKSGEIFESSTSRTTILLNENKKINDLISHFRDQVPWESTNVYSIMLQKICKSGGEYKGLRSYVDVVSYYKRMDSFYEEVLLNGLRIPPRVKWRDTFENDFALNGITVEVLDSGELSFAGRGSHRFAMSLSAGRVETPAYLVGISKKALVSGTWKLFLRRPKIDYNI